MFLPIRTKNPPERPPVVTFGLIGLNVLVYIFTSNGFEIKEAVVKQYALTHANAGPLTMLSSMFLHGGLMHILGNMWFLWILGAALEGRLGHLKYLALYLISGVAGAGLHLLMTSGMRDLPSLGASGAIMGLLGAALWIFPYSKVQVFYWFGFRWIGTWEWRMWGIALYYLGFDILEAALFAGNDGVAHFAHIGGAVGGFVLALLSMAPRDALVVSDAKSELADSSDIMALTKYELSQFAAAQPENKTVALAWLARSTEYGGQPTPDCLSYFNRHATSLIRDPETDVERLGSSLFHLSQHPGSCPAHVLLDGAVRLEKEGRPQLAAPILEKAMLSPDCTDAIRESATYRLAMIHEAWFQNYAKALQLFEEFLAHWPMSPMEGQVRERVRVLRTKAAGP